MISRYLFVCLYFLLFFLLNRWLEFYSTTTSQENLQEFASIDKLPIKQLQKILNLRGISFVNIREKNDLIKLVERTGSVRQSELFEPTEDQSKRQTTRFSSYKQLLDFVDDCKDTIWFIHMIPNEKRRQSLVYLSFDHWQTIERRLSIHNIQTGILNCSNTEYSNLCRSLTNERFVLLIPLINRRSTNINHFDIYSIEHFNYQYILKWLCKTLENHVNKHFDWIELPNEKRSILQFRFPSHSTVPIYYFTLLYRYGSMINFHYEIQSNETFQIEFSFENSSRQTYIYNNRNLRHELYSYRSLNSFLACLTINYQTLITFWFSLMNIYFFYEIYFLQSIIFWKKIFILNFISGIFCSIIVNYLSGELIDSILQMISFNLMQYSVNSNMLTLIRTDFLVYSTMSKWILYPMMIGLHILLGLSFRWYLKKQFGRLTYDFAHNIRLIDQIHSLCSNIWQYILCILFSDQSPNEHMNYTFLQYFSPDSLWLHQHSLLSLNSNEILSTRTRIDFNRLPIWRFTIRRRKTTQGASEYYSDIDLEQPTDLNEQNSTFKKPSMHRRMTKLEDNCYTSESDENNNCLIEMNSSEIYQCSICLEKYVHNVYICTLPCLHHFHRKCLFNWLCNSEHTTCPLCRQPVSNE